MSDLAELDCEFFRRTEEENAVLCRAWQNASPLDWGGWLIRRGMPLHPRKASAPHEPGIYGLFMADGGMVYIGKARSLCNRLSQHYQNSFYRRSRWWDAFVYVQVPEYALRDVEVAHIWALQPEYNELFEAAHWPQSEAMEAALRTEWSIA